MFVCFVQMHKVFTNRWSAFHAPVMTADFKLHPEFCQRDTDKRADQDFEKKTGSNQLHSEMKDREPGAFHEHYMSADMNVWIRTFLKA